MRVCTDAGDGPGFLAFCHPGSAEVAQHAEENAMTHSISSRDALEEIPLGPGDPSYEARPIAVERRHRPAPRP